MTKFNVIFSGFLQVEKLIGDHYNFYGYVKVYRELVLAEDHICFITTLHHKLCSASGDLMRHCSV